MTIWYRVEFRSHSGGHKGFRCFSFEAEAVKERDRLRDASWDDVSKAAGLRS